MLICNCMLISQSFYLALVMISLLAFLIAVYVVDIYVITWLTLASTSPVTSQFMEISVQLVILSKAIFSELIITWVNCWPL